MIISEVVGLYVGSVNVALKGTFTTWNAVSKILNVVPLGSTFLTAVTSLSELGLSVGGLSAAFSYSIFDFMTSLFRRMGAFAFFLSRLFLLSCVLRLHTVTSAFS